MSLLVSQPELEDLLHHAGIKKRRVARVGGAIALCEAPVEPVNSVPYADASRLGDLDKVDAKWGPSVGLWQVRTLKAELGEGTIRDYDMLVDNPAFQAYAAVQIRKAWGGTWNAWATFTSDMFKAYLPDLYPPDPGMYTVKYGDTLSDIALDFNASVEELIAWNDLDSDLIFIGQNLFIEEPS